MILNRILHAFDAPKPQPLPEPDAKLALGALMVRVAKSDMNYQVSEISRIDKLLARLNRLKPIEAAKMRATCEKLDKAAPDTVEFGRLIRETVSMEARLDALEALWEVVLADGVRRDVELRVVEEVREALGLSEADSDQARSIAEETLGGAGT
ncbi:TerB family tellurite resistance protein [Roseovarius faecimaris]|uniref:TerB family tellurite resistance protein n=1 Tax=Roseovarius faecimaris TaxID=2494550 RepID=A0A6I6IP29_9RHOB|nr:TerB family tellurite resistance protein [Roseovarius faecimaris]QGX97864.1 TerB family tellurite resistance protein [Roseovarius faecimaris]